MRKAAITVLTCLALSWTGRLAGQVAIRSIRLTLDPVAYSGPCPARLRAHVVFESNYPARVDEDDWGWNFGRLAPHSWDVAGGHLRTSGRETAVDTTLTIPHAGESAGGGLVHEGSAYVIMALNPTISNTVSYSVRCAPAVRIDPNLVKPIQPKPSIALSSVPHIQPPSGGAAGPPVHLPDLVPDIQDPFAFRYAVRNVGDAPAGPSVVLLKCRVISGGSKGSCPSDPSFAPLYDAALGGLVVALPGIPAGGTQVVPLPAHGPLAWPTGAYEFTAVADARHAVTERSETNNVATRTAKR